MNNVQKCNLPYCQIKWYSFSWDRICGFCMMEQRHISDEKFTNIQILSFPIDGPCGTTNFWSNARFFFCEDIWNNKFITMKKLILWVLQQSTENSCDVFRGHRDFCRERLRVSRTNEVNFFKRRKIVKSHWQFDSSLVVEAFFRKRSTKYTTSLKPSN